jgi:hypothetical protein
MDELDVVDDETGNGSRVLQAGVSVGAGGLIVAIILGIAANWRGAGLGVAPALVSESLHLRALCVLFFASVALLTPVLWNRLAANVPSLAPLHGRLKQMLVLCAVGPVLVVGANYAIASGIAPDYIALLPAFAAFAVAVLYSGITYPLSGITGVGLGTRQMLRTSCIWLLIAAGLHVSWTTARIVGDQTNLLWMIERPALEVGMIGFGITASFAVLLSNLSAIYHSRNMTQALVRSHQFLNGLIALWGLTLMWAIRFPGGYQGLASAVIGVGLMIVLIIIAESSGLLRRRGRRDDRWGDGVWAGRLASLSMLLVVISGVVIAVTGVILAGLAQRPPPELLGALLAAVGLGIVPLSVVAGIAPLMRRHETVLVAGGAMVGAGVIVSVVLRSIAALSPQPVTVNAATAEIVVGIGLALIVLRILQIGAGEA